LFVQLIAGVTVIERSSEKAADSLRAIGPLPRRRCLPRDTEARPLWSQISDSIHGDAVRNVLPKEQFGTALGYLRNHEELFLTYLGGGGRRVGPARPEPAVATKARER